MNKKFIKFECARIVIRGEKIANWKKWVKYCSSGRKPSNIPSNPNKTYKDNGWIGWADWLGTNNKKFNKKYIVNEDFFKTWSCEMSYVLGLWWADGCLYGKYNNMFNISLHKNDHKLLESILCVMDSTHRIFYQENMAKITIGSKKLCEDLIKLGGCKRKSLTAAFPNVPTTYLPDFIRGLWDGDGTIYFNSKSKDYISSIMSGNEIFLTKMHSELQSNIKGLKGSIYHGSTYLKKYDKWYHNRFVLQFGIKDTQKLSIYLKYDKCNLSLDRKKHRFLMVKQPIEYLEYYDARLIYRSLRLSGRNEWRQRYSEFKELGVPKYPESIYKNEWNGWKEWK